MSVEAYKVAIKIELMNLAIPGLLSLSKYMKAGAKDAAAY
jgi:hypothetical protein